MTFMIHQDLYRRADMIGKSNEPPQISPLSFPESIKGNVFTTS